MHRCQAQQRLASEVERRFLCLHGATRTRASNVQLVDVRGVCAAVRGLTSSQTLVESVANIATLPAYITPVDEEAGVSPVVSGLLGLGKAQYRGYKGGTQGLF